MVVVCTMLVQPVLSLHATSRDVTYGGNEMVVGSARLFGGRMRVHGGWHLTSGELLS
jgi:hypothetical protein